MVKCISTEAGKVRLSRRAVLRDEKGPGAAATPAPSNPGAETPRPEQRERNERYGDRERSSGDERPPERRPYPSRGRR